MVGEERLFALRFAHRLRVVLPPHVLLPRPSRSSKVSVGSDNFHLASFVGSMEVIGVPPTPSFSTTESRSSTPSLEGRSRAPPVRCAVPPPHFVGPTNLVRSLASPNKLGLPNFLLRFLGPYYVRRGNSALQGLRPRPASPAVFAWKTRQLLQR